MKKILLLITVFIALFFVACETKPNYPTSGKIELTQGKIDTLTSNIKYAVKDSMKKGREAIATFQQDSIYNLEWIQSDELPIGTVQKVRFDYSGKNISSRIVRRKAAAYLKADLTVLAYENLIYVDAMDKDSIKNSLRTVD
jgi:hypothetical protein